MPVLSSISSRLDLASPGDAVALGVVLGIWAHPDDEAYLSAGLMALARRAGNRVVCVTMTPGEHGTDDPAQLLRHDWRDYERPS